MCAHISSHRLQLANGAYQESEIEVNKDRLHLIFITWDSSNHTRTLTHQAIKSPIQTNPSPAHSPTWNRFTCIAYQNSNLTSMAVAHRQTRTRPLHSFASALLLALFHQCTLSNAFPSAHLRCTAHCARIHFRRCTAEHYRMVMIAVLVHWMDNNNSIITLPQLSFDELRSSAHFESQRLHLLSFGNAQIETMKKSMQNRFLDAEASSFEVQQIGNFREK